MDWTTVLIVFFGVAGTLGAVFITNYLNERKERRLKKEKEEELKQKKRNEFFNTYSEMLENEVICKRIWDLVNKESFKDKGIHIHRENLEMQVNGMRYCQMLWMRNFAHPPKTHYAATSSANSPSTNFLFSSTSSIS